MNFLLHNIADVLRSQIKHNTYDFLTYLKPSTQINFTIFITKLTYSIKTLTSGENHVNTLNFLTRQKHEIIAEL